MRLGSPQPIPCTHVALAAQGQAHLAEGRVLEVSSGHDGPLVSPTCSRGTQ